MTTIEENGWIPIGIDWHAPEPVVTWFRLGNIEFDDAYFWETVERTTRHPFNLAFRRETSLDALEAAARSADAPPLSGIVFHMSRCGSTLVSRSLSSLPETLVIAEAPPVDAIVRAHMRGREVTHEQQVRWLRCMVAVLGGALSRRRRHYVLKTDAWNTLSLPLFEQAFPGVPWVFVYRDPVEVLVSQMQGGSFMMSCANAPDFLGIPVADAIRLPREEYCARVLGRLVAAIADCGADAEALVNYAELPASIWERIAPRFGITISPREIDAIARGSAFHAKRAGLPFQDDRPTKQNGATAALRAAAATWITPSIARLEHFRTTGR